MITSVVVSPKWLFEHLNDSQVVIVDCRFSLADSQLGQKQYQEGHITGSYYLDLNQDLSSPVREHGGRHPLPNISNLADKLAEIGVNYQKTLVVAYDDSRLAFASRLWWLLRYLGHDKVAVLDGGFAGWQKAGYAVSKVIPGNKTGEFVPQLQAHTVVDYTYVKNRKDRPDVVLVDARESDRYRGEREPIDKIAGHIPGAVNYPWQEVTDASGFLLPQSEQHQRWKQLETAKEIIVYCGSGVTACVNLLSLEIAEIPTGKLYAGSWSDWITY
ncbi:sulfurtransferase [Anabaena cylindrica FACHB-243]|uniref:3-mercaptopyruvate sulfurtransferase n=1 Tax=Anabaena cylindrica (strain ATCC 27899 / PCC 7122) TaxID=272123 RepID=K9ZNN3_ANACC|nr:MULTISPECIES: sulfurtransferase [Anabaena]AFZ60843.1 3-mercaptopyruvate sulfurtransferase [Anabaena cylindrica PCC 7122]MBD2420535.1 sulfurtransferase [Anabaena cylindrica FACHB-243]MBY5281054.1 sulfurtransferase [Anabaena sp. CCAP 1446/1C]MBY5309080.1 sulfurtransferase [Anabaena sp. CCAP 1446/1C]MCM2406840.1 sulfurtransferase [Anabaena sp. CCAP 1446/1C]